MLVMLRTQERRLDTLIPFWKDILRSLWNDRSAPGVFRPGVFSLIYVKDALMHGATVHVWDYSQRLSVCDKRKLIKNAQCLEFTNSQIVGRRIRL
jgi:hypothetical protein